MKYLMPHRVIIERQVTIFRRFIRENVRSFDGNVYAEVTEFELENIVQEHLNNVIHARVIISAVDKPKFFINNGKIILRELADYEFGLDFEYIEDAMAFKLRFL